jgi:hypothetical protein
MVGTLKADAEEEDVEAIFRAAGWMAGRTERDTLEHRERKHLVAASIQRG